jgi:2-methylcitrate dehydratase PrpD
MGVTGARNAIEGEKGFYHTYHQDSYSHDILVGELGERFESANISIKPYPSCRGTHPFIDAALQVRREHDLNPDDVERVTIYCGAGTQGLLCEPFEFKIAPRNPVDGQFSVPWGVAVSLTRGRPGLNDYTDEAIRDTAILAMSKRITVTRDPKLDGTGLEPARVEVTTKRGATFDAFVEIATGSPGNMLKYAEVERKFRDCVATTERRLSAANTDRAVDFIGELERADDVRRLLDFLIWE